MIANYQSTYRVSPLALFVLVLTLVQGTSTSLALAFHFARSMEVFVNITWLGLYLLAAAGLFANFGLNWITWLVRYRSLLIVLLFGVAVSSTWSYDPGLSAERSVHMVGSTLIACLIGFCIPLTRIISVSAVVLTVLMIASVAMAILAPTYGTEPYNGVAAWRGIVAGKNTLGFWAATAFMLNFHMMTQSHSMGRKAGWFFALLVAALCLNFSVSATSVLALAVASVVVAGLYCAHRFELGLIKTACLALLAGGVIVVLFQQINTAELIGRSGDLTGRSDVWLQTWELILQRPLTGYGYGTLWYPTASSQYIQHSLLDFSWTVYHAHNGFLHVASEIGLPLAIIGVLMVFQQLIEVIYCQYQQQQSGTLFVLAFTVALLLSNYSEARFLVNREMYWIFFIAMPISMLRQVSVVMRDGQHNPISIPLNDKQRFKAFNLVDIRIRNRAMKTRLKDIRNVLTDTKSKPPQPQVFDGQVTSRRSNR